MSDNDINRIKQNIEQLQNQNAIDFQQWKRLGKEIEKLEEKIKISNCNLNLLIKKIKADYESLRRIIIDENVQVQLNEKIEQNKNEINKKVNNETFENKVDKINSQLDNIEIKKLDKNEIITMANMGQDVKEAMTGGSVAVVGKNAILNENIVNNQISPDKTNFIITGNNLFNKDLAKQNTYMHGNGRTEPSNSYFITDYISVLEGEKYTITKFRLVTFFDSNLNAMNGSEINNASLVLNMTITIPTGAKYIIVSGSMTHIDSFMIVKGETMLDFEPYQCTIKYNKKSNADNLIIDETIDYNLLKGTYSNNNYFNKETAVIDKYIAGHNGAIEDNTNYYASDFIPVRKDAIYTVTNCRTMAYYDNNKNYLSGLSGSPSESNTFTSPYDGYVRLTVSKPTIDNYMMVDGNVLPETYISYSNVIKKNIEWLVVKKSNLSNDIVFEEQKDIFECILPKEICIAKNSIIEIYNSQICWCGNINNYHFEYNSTIGYTAKRKFVVDGSKYNIGNYPLTVIVYDNNLKEVARCSTTLKILDKSSTNGIKKLLCIGDSLTNGKLWLNEILNLSSSLYGTQKIELVGTLGSGNIKHEGRSGWSSTNYIQDSSYSYLGNYKVKAKLTTKPFSKKQYRSNNGAIKWEVESVELIGNNTYWIYINRLSGQGALNTTGVLTAVDNGVTGDTTISYTEAVVTSKNPFWNASTNEVDFAYYESQTGIKPDVVQIYLGTNDYGRLDSQVVNNIKILIDAILRDWNIPIMIVLVPFRSNQDGIGLQEGNSRVYIKNRLTVFSQHKAYINAFDNYNDKVYLVHVGATHDSDYNYGTIQKQVNPRNPYTICSPIESVHPQESGYLQMADAMWGTLLKIIQ